MTALTSVVLLGISAELITKIQRIQNIAAQIITGCRKHDRISPVLKEFHWLPVNERIQFKALVLPCKSLHAQTPAYLAELIHGKVNTRTLRSSSELIFDVPKYGLKTYGQNAFGVATPTLWKDAQFQIR